MELVLAAVQLEVIELLVLDLHHYKDVLLFYALDQITRLPLVAVVVADVNPTLTLLLDLMDLEMEIHLFLL